MKFLNIFGLVFLIGSAFAGCDEDLPIYQLCASKAKQFDKFKTKEDVASYCQSFEVDECKEFLKIINTKSECVNSSDVSVLATVSGYQLPYLAYCAKKDESTDCPITTFIKENYDNFNNIDLTKIPDSLNEVISNDCKEEKCNSRLITIGENLEVPAIQAGAPMVFGDLFKFYKVLGENYKNKNCDAKTYKFDDTNGNTDATTGNNNKGEKDENDGAITLNRLTFSFIGMILLSIVMLL